MLYLCFRESMMTRSFDVFFDLRPNKRLSKQSWGWWFETSSRSLLRHCNDFTSATYLCFMNFINHFCFTIYMIYAAYIWSCFYILCIFAWHLYYLRFVLFILYLLLFIDYTRLKINLMLCLWIILLILSSVAYCVYAFNIVRSVVPEAGIKDRDK